MLQVVVQAPEIPSPPPGFPTSGGLPLAVVVIVILGIAGVVAILWPLARALARRIERGAHADPALQEDIDQLRARLNDVDALQARIAELEERVDFTERLLAQKRQPEQLGR
jgi:Tfp pilus assembly protein PilN